MTSIERRQARLVVGAAAFQGTACWVALTYLLDLPFILAIAPGFGYLGSAGAHFAFARTLWRLSRTRWAALIGIQQAGFLPPVVAAAHFSLWWTLLLVPFCAGGVNAVVSFEKVRLMSSIVWVGSVTQARAQMRACRRLLTKGFTGGTRAFIALNFTAATREAYVEQELLHEAWRAIEPLFGDRTVPATVRAMAAAELADLANGLVALTGDVRLFRAAQRAMADAVVDVQDEPRLRAGVLERRAELALAEISVRGASPLGFAEGVDDFLEIIRAGLRDLDEASRIPGHKADNVELFRGGLLLLETLLSGMEGEELRRTSMRALASMRTACQLTKGGPDGRAVAAVNLAWGLTVVARQLDEPDLLDEAERLVAPEAHRNASSLLQVQVARAMLDVQQARADLAMESEPDHRFFFADLLAAAKATPASFGRLGAIRQAAAYAAEHDMADEAAMAYLDGLALARELAGLRFTRTDKGGPLRDAQGMAVEAAYWLLQANRPVDAAVALELGRVCVATEVMGRERLVAELQQSGQAELAQQWMAVTEELARLELEGSLDVRLENAKKELARLRKRVGGHLRPVSYSDLRAAGAIRPLVYLAAAEHGGFALIVTRDTPEPIVIDLPGLTALDLLEVALMFRDGLRSLRSGQDSVWQQTLATVLEHLADLVTRQVDGWIREYPSVTLVPCGLLGLFPLDGGGPACTYAPAATFCRVQPGELSPNGMLAVCSPGEGPDALRDVSAEMAAIRAVVPAAVTLSDNAATRAGTLARMPDHEVFHFCCHGRADPDDPLSSRLELADEPLTVRDILSIRLPRARLAFLSACQTAVPDSDLLDEVVSLPAALLEAGVPAIIGSLWEVAEQPTVLLVTRFYELWARGADPPRALHQARAWLRDSTNAQLNAYAPDLIRAPRLTGHGRSEWADLRPFASPDHWAGFIYVGS